MVLIGIVDSKKLPALREAFFCLDWQLWEVASFSLGGELVTRIIIRCDEMPSPKFDISISIEAVFEEPKYCHVCSKKLQPHNVSGYCYRHQDKDPRRSLRKLKG